VVQSYYQLNSSDRVLQFASLNFYASLEQIFSTLITGARLILRSAQIWTMLELYQNIVKHKMTVVNFPPAYWQQWLQESVHLPKSALNNSLKLVIIGGDVISPEMLYLWQQTSMNSIRLLNAYGPTETTITTTLFEIASQYDDEKYLRIPIGRPIANKTAYILDTHNNLVPIGVTGELYIGSAGLARGYLNRPELTAEKFITNPFSDDPNSRLYKTGDLACYLPDGNIEYLGRIDNQVKIRGFRIELGEIEAVLAQHPLVKENAVIVHETSKTDKRLIAYVVPTQGQVIENTALREFLKERLPDYMIPSAFVTKENLPLTPNGKIDRRALSQLSVTSYQLSEKTYKAPRTPDEELLAEIWASVLEHESIGIHDNFFELGGHSLLAVSLLAQIEQQFGKQLPLSALFQGATIAELARLLKNSTDTTHQWAPLVAIQPNGTKRPLFCVPGAGGNVLYYYQLARHLGQEQPFYGLQAVGLDGETPPDTRVEDMAARYLQEIQTVEPQGPYFLGGHSFGANVVLEMSKQLQLKGQQVARLIIFDSTVPLNQPIGLDWDEAQWTTDVARIIERLLDKKLPLSLADFQQREPTAQLDLLHKTLADNDWAISKPQLQGLLKTFKANNQTEYVPQDIQPVPISLFKASDILTETASGIEMERLRETLKQQADWGWREYAAGPVEILMVPGDHHTMMSEPHVQVLAEKLRECLDNCVY
jgi:thioesterase domain-containing protein/acyl carrier protein